MYNQLAMNRMHYTLKLVSLNKPWPVLIQHSQDYSDISVTGLPGLYLNWLVLLTCSSLARPLRVKQALHKLAISLSESWNCMWIIVWLINLSVPAYIGLGMGCTWTYTMLLELEIKGMYTVSIQVYHDYLNVHHASFCKISSWVPIS